MQQEMGGFGRTSRAAARALRLYVIQRLCHTQHGEHIGHQHSLWKCWREATAVRLTHHVGLEAWPRARDSNASFYRRAVQQGHGDISNCQMLFSQESHSGPVCKSYAQSSSANAATIRGSQVDFRATNRRLARDRVSTPSATDSGSNLPKRRHRKQSKNP